MSRNENGFTNKNHNAGCPVLVGNQICGETQTLEIIKEFRKLYEDKMQHIQSGGDYESSLQAKVNLQQDWIRDLTEQNEMLVRAVEELEMEATDRVAMLEEKLRCSAQQGNEVMQKFKDFNFAINLDETFQKLVYLQSDVRNLLEFIKRARDKGTWSIDGLHFYNITCEDLFGSSPCRCDEGIGDQRIQKQLKISEKLEQKDKMLRESKEILDRIPNETESLAVRLKEKDQELNTLRRSMLDMRNALTIEVAEKHDVILNLRRDVQQLEEKYRQANKQTQFKDDIIKEMRKEIKLLKGQLGDMESERKKFGTTTIKHFRQTLENIQEEVDKSLTKIKEKLINNSHISMEASADGEDLRKRVQELEDENSVLKNQIAEARGEIDILNKQANAITHEFAATTEQYEQDRRQSKSMIEALKQENRSMETSAGGEDLRKRVQELADENSVLKNQIAEARGEIDILNKQANAMTNEFAATTEQYEQDRRQSKSMIEALKQENISMEASAGGEDLRKRMQELADENSVLKNQIAEARGQIDILNKQANAMTNEFAVTAEQYEQYRRQSKSMIEALKQENISMEASAGGEDLRKRVQELEDENSVLKNQIAKARGEIDILNKQANAMTNEFAATAEQYEQYRRQSKSMIEALKQENVELADIKNYTHNTETGIQSVSENGLATVNRLQKELENLRNEHCKAQDQILTLNAEIHAQNERIEELQELLQQKGIENPYAELRTRKSQTSSTGSWSTPNNSEAIMPNAIRKDLPQGAAELQEALEKAQRDREIERAKHNQEIINLKQTISELEKALRNTQIRGDSLQKTVDLYQNSVNVLEASEQQSRIEMSQLRQTILNLQDALVTSKHQLDDLQEKASSEIYKYIQCVNDLRNILLSMEYQRISYHKELDSLNELVEDLRDTNLDIAVDNFGYIQDVVMLETRLLKYQQICRSYEDCICGLKNELIKLRAECKHQIKTNSYLKQQLAELSCACQSMQNMEAESKELQKMLQRVNGDLHRQADITKQELLREAQVNNMNAERIEELQNIVGAKTMELNQCAGDCCKMQQQLKLTIKQNQELKAELAQLKNQIQNYREAAAASEERSEYVQKEIENCKCNITELSNRYMKTKEQLQQKNEMCSKLETELSVLNSNCLCLEKQLEDSKKHYEIDTSDLRNTVTNLNDKLTKTENNYKILHEDCRRSQDQILEMTQRETENQQRNEQHEKESKIMMQTLQKEELRLSECVCQLQAECAIIKKELVDRERRLQLSQEENVNLKSELNKVLQRYDKLKAEHDQLHTKCDELRSGLSKTEYQSHVTKEQFNQCLCGLQNVHMQKDHLEAENKQLQTELEELRVAYRDMEQKYKKLNESVATLEMKLLDNNMCREEICAESRNVIINVRAWLQNQTTINEELTQKLRDDEILIENLKQQIAISRNKKCCKIRQRGGGLTGDRSLKFVATRSQPDLWSPGSQGSGTVSPSSVVSNTQEWYAYEEFDEDYIEDDSLLGHCLKRVESINEELQKSNQFWQNKMMDHDYLVTRDQ